MTLLRLLLPLAALLVALPAASQVIGLGGTALRRSTDCSAETGAVREELCHETTDETLWICDTTTCEGAGWLKVAEGLNGVRLRSGPGDPNDGGGAHNCVPAGTLGRCPCDVGLTDRFFDTSAVAEYVCSSASVDTWVSVLNGPLDVGLLAGEVGADNRLIALGGTDARQSKVGKCSLTATRDGIVCDASTLSGQSTVLLEDSDLGSNAWSLGIGQTNLAGNATWGVTAAEGALMAPAESGYAFRERTGAAPSDSPTDQSLIYYDVNGSGWPILTLVPDSAERYLVMLGYGLADTYIPMSETGASGAVQINSSIKQNIAGAAATEVGFPVQATVQYFRLDESNNDTAPSTACDNSAEAGRAIVKSGAAVTAGNGGLCVCVNQGGITDWVCY